MLWSRRRYLLLSFHRPLLPQLLLLPWSVPMFLRLLMPSWSMLLLNWTGCGRIFLAPTLAWWPGAWSWLRGGFAPMPRFGRHWFRPRRPVMERGRPPLRRRLLETRP